MNIGGLGNIWRNYISKKPAVPKPSAVDSEGVMAGEGNESREHNDYTERKKAEASTHYVYGADGKKESLDDGDHHAKLDEIG